MDERGWTKMLFLKNFLQQNEPVCPRFWAVSDLVVGDPFHSSLSFWNFAKSILLGNGYPTTKLGTAQNRGQTSLKMLVFLIFRYQNLSESF